MADSESEPLSQGNQQKRHDGSSNEESVVLVISGSSDSGTRRSGSRDRSTARAQEDEVGGAGEREDVVLRDQDAFVMIRDKDEGSSASAGL